MLRKRRPTEYGIRVPGGISVAELDEALDVIREEFEFAGGGIAAYDPGVDIEDRALHAGLHVLRSLAGSRRTATADVGDRIG
jgi:arginase family enzyme